MKYSTKMLKICIFGYIIAIGLLACSKKEDAAPPSNGGGNGGNKPIVNFGYFIDNSNPRSVQFIDSSKNIDANASYNWNLGNGLYTFGRKPSYIYDSAGTYSVKLIILNPGGGKDKDSLVKSVVMPKIIPTPNFTKTPNAAYPSLIKFKNTSTDATSCSLDFGDGEQAVTIEADEEVEHLYKKSGPVTVTLTATSKSGNKRATSQTITLGDVKVATVTGIQVERIPEKEYDPAPDDGSFADLLCYVYDYSTTTKIAYTFAATNALLPYTWKSDDPDKYKHFYGGDAISFYNTNTFYLYDQDAPAGYIDYLIKSFNFSVLDAVKNSGSASPYPTSVYIINELHPEDVTKSIQIKLFLSWN